ncbi:MAG: FtsX-like permease family protein, partial [Gemmatimonadetes bacterium]
IALSVMLLVVAGLFIRSLVNVARVDLGLNTDDVVTFRISPARNGYDSLETRALFERTEEAMRAIPGVTQVSAAMVPVLGGSSWGTDVAVQGWESGPDIDSNARFNWVGPGFLSVLEMPLLAGREFTDADAAGQPPVAIVNEAFTRKFNLDGADAVGKFMSTNSGAEPGELDREIVGVVRDAKYNDVKEAVPPLFFLPWRQVQGSIPGLTFYLRTGVEPSVVMGQVPQAMKAVDPNLPVESLKTLQQEVDDRVVVDRFISTLAVAFALLATLLAAVGLYGVLAYTVALRTREIGVRVALGADRGQVQGMVVRQVGRLAVVGGVIGLAASFFLGRGAESLLFELKGWDPLVMAGVIVVLGLVCLIAAYAPALRASRVDPMTALRWE